VCMAISRLNQAIQASINGCPKKRLVLGTVISRWFGAIVVNSSHEGESCNVSVEPLRDLDPPRRARTGECQLNKETRGGTVTPVLS